MDWVEELFDGPYAGEYTSVTADTERTAQEVEFIVRELALASADSVLDLACGHGRHAIAVASHVDHVVGSDRTVKYIDFARKRAAEESVPNIEFVVEDMRELSYVSKFDACWNFFTSWGYYDAETNFDVLKRVARALKPGGRFLLEIIGRDALMRRYTPHDWHTLDNGTIMLEERRFDFAAGRQHSIRTYIKDGKVQTIDVDHQLPSPDHLASMLMEVGFSGVRVVSSPDGGPVGRDSFRVAIIGTVA